MTAAVPGDDPRPVVSYDVSAAARVVVEAHGHNERWPGIRAGQAYGVALSVWSALTGAEGDEALALALAAAARPTTAHTTPF